MRLHFFCSGAPLRVLPNFSHMILLTKALGDIIADVLPKRFGIVWDGWTFRSEHYLAVFAVFGHDGKMEKILLAISTLADDDIVNHSALAHVAFLRMILWFFKRSLSDILYIVADNCATNGCIASLMKAPFVECASHRLSLAVVEYMECYESILDKMQSLTRKLRGLNASASLR
ncbi:hypothetical protein F443_07717 [Phytophthora nicotianae P1569]|uniref:DUF659 domain-containing protein n=1 Tax=Phytophthora nicotianae P1569 TaxID=1317065 RepID=V9FAS8_PHYNI|nr:hypothetical protein F443_07717 [Phytophthora nicotianae P1569]